MHPTHTGSLQGVGVPQHQYLYNLTRQRHWYESSEILRSRAGDVCLSYRAGYPDGTRGENRSVLYPLSPPCEDVPGWGLYVQRCVRPGDW